MKETMSPFVKWAGGKGQLVERLHQRMPKEYSAYYEPFVGGGALVFYVQPERDVFINDINAQLINTYYSIKDDVDGFLKMIEKMDSIFCTNEHYYKMRSKYNDKIADTEYGIETAALFVYLNKHCFNGLYRVNGKGLFNVPWNNKTTGHSIDQRNIRAISRYLNKPRVHIASGDFEEVCKTCTKGDFVFFDSPYDVLSDTAGFADYTKESFKEIDHRRLASLYEKLTQKGVKCMLTNHNTALIRELYKDFDIELVEVRRSINADASKRKGEEVIITNY